MVATSTFRRTVTISAHRSLGYKVPSLSSANVFSTKALVAGPAHYQSPKQRVTRWMIDLATFNSPVAPGFLSPIAKPDSVYSPAGSPSVNPFSLSVSGQSSISSSSFRTPVKASRSASSASSGSYDLAADLDRMHDLIAGVEAQEQLSPLIDSTISQPSNDSITMYTNTSVSAQTWDSQAASNSDLPLDSPCIRLNVSPVPSTPASDSTVSYIPSPSFGSSIESIHYRCIPVFTTVTPFESVPGSWVDDALSWSDIIKPATVISIAFAAAAAAFCFW